MTRAVPRRRITDRSLQLLALALVCYGVTYAGYRLIFGIHDAEPMVAIAREAQVVLEALPPQHDLRSELGDLTRQAAALARGDVVEEAKSATPVEQRPDVAPDASDASAKPAEPPKSREQLFAESKVAVATGLMRVIDTLQDRCEQGEARVAELEARIAAGEPAEPAKSAKSAKAAEPAPASETGEGTAPLGEAAPELPTGDGERPLAEQLADAQADFATGVAVLPKARGLRRLALWLSDEKKWDHEQYCWATFWAMAAAAIPTGISFVLLVRGRKLLLSVPAAARLPAASVRRREQERDVRQGVMASYFMHAVPLLLSALSFAHAYKLGPPGGGGGPAGPLQAEQEEVKVVKVQARKYIVNPFSSVLINAPKELDLQLDELTRRMAEAGSGKAGGEGTGEGAGYEGGTAGGKIQFVVVNHGGAQWDQVVPVAAPALLTAFRTRVGVPTASRPITVKIADLAAQKNPAEQPPLIYMSFDGSGYRFSPEDIRFLAKYTSTYGGMILVDDIAGGRQHAEALARQVFPGKPLVPIPKDDHLFRSRVPMVEADRALAAHGGQSILGVRDQGRWVMVYHPGDLVDGWRKAYGDRWQESAFQFGINVWDYATKNFTRRLRTSAK